MTASPWALVLLYACMAACVLTGFAAGWFLRADHHERHQAATRAAVRPAVPRGARHRTWTREGVPTAAMAALDGPAYAEQPVAVLRDWLYPLLPQQVIP